MLKRLSLLLLILVIFSAAFLSYIRGSREATESSFALDTVISVSAKGKNAKEAVNSAIQRIFDIEKQITSYSEDSDLFTGILHSDSLNVIKRGLYFGDKSGGCFDITVKPLVDLWGITSQNPKVPQKHEIEKILPLIDYRKVHINGDKLSVPKGMSIDLGGIGKGYAADQAAAVLKERGINNGLIDLGGNIVVIGSKKIGVQNPKSAATGDYLAVIDVKDCSVVTSGSYERNFTENGITYHHILNPRTGYPAESGLVSATVICESSQDADAIATIIFILGAKEGLAFANEMGVQAMTIDQNNKVEKTENLNVKITNNTFNF